jgi:hypothetical protein
MRDAGVARSVIGGVSSWPEQTVGELPAPHVFFW